MVSKSVEYFIAKIPEEYRGLIKIESGGEGKGGSARVTFTNKICGCKSRTTIKAIIARRQLDYCKSCSNIEKNKNSAYSFDTYLDRIPVEFRDNVNRLKEGNGFNEVVQYRFKCGCDDTFKIGDLANREQFVKCKSCVSRESGFKSIRPLDYYLSKIDNVNNITVIGEYIGVDTIVEYRFSCNHIKRISIGKLLQLKRLDLCDKCLHPVYRTKKEMTDHLSDCVKNPKVVSGFPGNRTTIISALCKSCGADIKDTFFNIQQYYLRNKKQCKACAPKSIVQQEIFEFVSGVVDNVIQSDLSTIKFSSKDSRFKELDIYCPDRKFAIEYNGLYFHSEKYKKDRSYHWKKTKAAADLDISLLHIWEDKWNKSPEIYKSIIKSKLGCVDEKIYARKTSIVEMSKDELKLFFNANHLDGHVGCITGWGLLYNGEIIQAISVRKVNGQNKKYKSYIEIARSATKLNTQVLGGESKLLSKVEDYFYSNNFKGIVNYVDCNFGSVLRPRWKFSHKGFTEVSYFYIKKNEFIRVSRQKVQARDGKTEKELAESLGLLRVNSNKNLIYEFVVEEGYEKSLVTSC